MHAPAGKRAHTQTHTHEPATNPREDAHKHALTCTHTQDCVIPRTPISSAKSVLCLYVYLVRTKQDLFTVPARLVGKNYYCTQTQYTERETKRRGKQHAVH